MFSQLTNVNLQVKYIVESMAGEIAYSLVQGKGVMGGFSAMDIFIDTLSINIGNIVYEQFTKNEVNVGYYMQELLLNSISEFVVREYIVDSPDDIANIIMKNAAKLAAMWVVNKYIFKKPNKKEVKDTYLKTKVFHSKRHPLVN